MSDHPSPGASAPPSRGARPKRREHYPDLSLKPVWGCYNHASEWPAWTDQPIPIVLADPEPASPPAEPAAADLPLFGRAGGGS